MSLCDILVHVDRAKTFDKRMAAAVNLAREHNAHLIGLGVNPPLPVAAYGVGPLPGTLMDSLNQQATEELEAAGTLFRKAAEAAGLPASTEWRAADDTVFDALSLHGRYADLTIVSQDDPDGDPTSYPNLGADLALSSGRPIMIVPYIGAGPTIGKKILLSWDGGREAGRAMHDALPLLEEADVVHVLLVEPRGLGDDPGADVARHLARHGVKVQVTVRDGSGLDAAQEMLNFVSDQAIDLMVMGCYGHSRLREAVFGGVTKTILNEMTIPVLLAH